MANKIRFALTTFGVMLAVSFVVSAFVLGDGLRSSFAGVSEEVTAGVDLEVRNVADFGDHPPLPADDGRPPSPASTVSPTPSPCIEAADNAVRPITADGGTITINGPPQLAFNWIDNQQLERVLDGRRIPAEVGEFTIDVDSAAKHGFVIGDTYEVMIPEWPRRPDVCRARRRSAPTTRRSAPC